MDPTYEVNFDGLVGPTHNYSGLSTGNIASTENKKSTSNPKEAALQGLSKMKFLTDLGLKQALFPPHERPYIPLLKKYGFTGTDSQIIEQAYKKAPSLLQAATSASSMWTANAGTVAPSADTTDNKVHLTPANLISKLHRSIEPPTTFSIFKKVFSNNEHFTIHKPLEDSPSLGDEGAANHTRLCHKHNEKGLHFFVYGQSAFDNKLPKPQHFPARQTLEASSSIAAQHQIPPEQLIMAQQNPQAVDKGVFHNDVISVGNESLFLYHEESFINTSTFISQLKNQFKKLTDQELNTIEVTKDSLTLEDAVSTYFFNSQILTLPDNSFALILPIECKEHSHIPDLISKIQSTNDNIFSQIHYIDLKQSMRNGGGPACLRLRVVLNQKELDAIHQPILFNQNLYHRLTDWINKHYRDSIAPNDIADPTLLEESRTALDELSQILHLGSIYPFQQT